MAASKQYYSEKQDLKEDSSDTWIGPKHSAQSKKCSPDQQIKHLSLMFDSVEDMLKSPDYDEDLKDEMSKACPNYMAVFSTSKRDLLRNDCGIVLTGETSAGKTTLINQLVGKKLFVTDNVAATGRITRIRNSEKLEIKCYSRDEILKKKEAIQDFKQLKVFIKRFTDIDEIPKDLQDIYYVDVFLPVPFLKGNVIIVDTPGIGENERLDKILLDFLPHAVSFVFVVNARNAGGIHEDRLSKILKTIVDNREKMPCFDPRDIMILTNQWDIVDNEDTSSDEDDDGKFEKKDEYTKTWKVIQTKFENGWGLYDEENMFRVSLKQVRKGKNNFFTTEYKRFETVLSATIHKNENKRVEYYYRFLKDFIRNGERGTLIRLNFLKKSKEEQQRIINQNNARIHDLHIQCKQKSKELEKYKTKMITTLAEKLYDYLNSINGREEILNPPGKKRMSEVSFLFITEEVPVRLQSGIKRWCKGPEVKSVIKDAEEKIRVFVEDIELKLHEIEIDMRGGTETFDDNTYSPGGATIVLGLLLLPLTLALAIVVGVVAIPIALVMSLINGSESRLNLANTIYDKLVQQIPMHLLRGGFEQSFGIEYGKAIVRVLDESLPNVIESLLIMNEKLLHTQNAIRQKEESFKRLEKKIQQIQIATDNFERDY